MSITSLSIDTLERILSRVDIPKIYELIQIHSQFYYAFTQLQFSIIYNHIKHLPKKAVLEYFVRFYSHLDEQGSDRWKNVRSTGVGGSEMATINNNNPHSNWKTLIGSKLSLSKYAFNGSIMTQWGNIFEPMLQLYMELMMNAKVYETGRIPGIIRNSRMQRIQGYSPDGLAIVKKEAFKFMIDYSAEEHDLDKPSRDPQFKKLPNEMTLLYEFKNPYIRVPKGIIKDLYIDQPKAGMCTIPMAEACIFVDGVFKKCSIEQFGMSRYYDVKFHCKPRKIGDSDVYIRSLKYEHPAACGFIGVMDMSHTYEQGDWESEDNEWRVDSSSVESSGEEESFESEEKLTLSKELKVKIAKQIITMCRNEVTAVKSEYFKLEFKFENALRIIKLVAALLDNVLNNNYDDFQISMDEQTELIYVIIKRLFPSTKSLSPDDPLISQLNSIKMLIPSTIDLIYDGEPVYDMEDLEYGTDFGDTRECAIEDFDDLAERLVKDRFRDDGYRLYYPDKFFYDPDSKIAPRLNRPTNYIDRTLEVEAAAKKWLYQNVEEFLEHCKKLDVRPLGIIPWKLYEVCCMPSYKDPNYLKKCAPSIVKFMDTVERYKKEMYEQSLTPDEIVAKLEEEFPDKKKKKRASPSRRAPRTGKFGKEIKSAWDNWG